MRDLSRSLLLATTTILCLTIRASSIQDISLVSPNSTTNTTNATVVNRGSIVCSPDDAVGADIRMCLSLLLELPETTVDGAFHDFDVPDIYQLPKVLRGDRCNVLVTVPTGRQEASNWPAIRFAANQVIAACTRGNYPFGTTSGAASVGLTGNIQVSIVNIPPGNLRVT